jgi:hypothetical protein
VNILKEWERDPPVHPMHTMAALWYDFKERREDPKSPVYRFRDDIPDLCAQQKDGKEALRIAVNSIRPNGKMHNHQSKVSAALPTLRGHLIAHYDLLIESANFAELHSLIWIKKLHGIGPMTVYDVSVRFGAWLGLKPEAIYIHAGTKAGLKALGVKPKYTWSHIVRMEQLPPILRRKDPDEVEDFLCTYRMAFELLKERT